MNDADILKANCDGDDAITCACLKGLTDIVSYLLNAANPGIRREIEADELLGCYFVQEKNDYRAALARWVAAHKKESKITFQCPLQPISTRYLLMWRISKH